MPSEFDTHFNLPLVGNLQADPASGALLRVNQALCDALGDTQRQLLGRSLHELIHREDAVHVDPLLKAMAAGTLDSFSVEVRLLCGDHRPRWFAFAAALAPGPTGEAPRLTASLLDIDNHRATEDAALRTQEFLSSELHAMESLHQLTIELQQIEDFEVALHHVLKAVATWNHTHHASLHFYREHGDCLELAAQCGLGPAAREVLRHLPAGPGTPLGMALAQKVEVAINDVTSDQRFAQHALATQLGYRGVHATPLLARSGQVLGVLTTYWSASHQPTGPALRLMDLYGRQIAHLVERKQSEESLGASEAAFRAMFESTAVGMAQIDSATGMFLRVNDTLITMSGYSRETLLQMPVMALTHPEDVVTTRHGFGALVLGEMERFNVEKRIVRSDGTALWVQATMNLVADADGTPLYTASVLQDISERKQMEHALRVSEQRFRTMADSVPVLIWVTGADGKPEFVNQSYMDFFGLRKHQVRGFDPRSLVHPEDVDEYFGSFAKAAEYGIPWEGRVRIRRVDGQWRWLQSRANPIFNANGDILGYAGSSPDVTDLLDAQSAMIEIDKRKDQFLATLAHELRNPLAPLSASLASLSHRRDPKVEREVFDRMQRQVAHMTRLVDDLMQVSRITRGTVELRKQSLELGEVLRNAIDTSLPLINAAGHRLTYVPQADELWVDGDPIRLAQVFSNLLNNAAKYSPAGSDIGLAIRRDGDSFEIKVSDTGEGMPAGRLNDIFDLFTQIDGASDRAQGGLGIGLTLVRSLVDLHGGEVSASSEGPGKGSCFTVRLPALEETHGSRAEEPKGDYMRDAPCRRILVVDDNRDGADAIAEFLGLMNHQVRTAYDGPAALLAAAEFAPELILLDLGMPGMDGYETCQRLRQQMPGSGCRIFALTGWGQSSDLQRTAASGFDHHLVKPVDLGTLAELLASSRWFETKSVEA